MAIQRTMSGKDDGPKRIPFYRNVKTIGVLAQVVFVVVVAIGAAVIVRNVATALQASNIPADFGFLSGRAGIPIAESVIRYNPDNSYLRAFVIGILNTLKVALVGVVVATVLGVLIGVMRLSANFLLRQIATVYVETIRNTPLAVQIVFWYTAILTPIPSRVLNALRLPGGVFISNQGIALPWAYPSYAFGRFGPVLVLALVAGVVTWYLRRRALQRADRPGNAGGPGFLVFLGVAIIGYFALGKAPLPEGAAVSFRETSGVISTFHDADGDGTRDASESYLAYAPVLAKVEEGSLRARSQDLVEHRKLVLGTFRFPPFLPSEYESAEVTFQDPEAADEAGLEIHYEHFPNRGVVFVDTNGNGAFDEGEQEAPEGGGYNAALLLTLEGFQRRIVTDRVGEGRIPRFVAAGSEKATSQGVNISPAQLFAAPAATTEAEPLETDFALQTARPFVWSRPSIPISIYEGGLELTTSYLALLIALVVYTASFIAEIVRGGLQAVAKGQTEAARALGLSNGQTFRLVVFPQAMRIILPPMISQFLNLTKNSSLAPLAAYAELFAISVIIANQTGASVPVTLMLIAAYVLISLAFALVLNIVNARMALVER